MPQSLITVNSLNYDHTLRRGWQAELVRQTGNLIELVGEFGFDVDHLDLGHIKTGTVSYEYYWLDRWFNVFRFHEPTGEFRCYYCNINFPPTLENGVLAYVDLDIDLLVDASGSIRVLDLEEFEENVRSLSIPDSISQTAKKTVDELINSIEKRQFPFEEHLPITA
jgi:protein associated with RNAse G/E